MHLVLLRILALATIISRKKHKDINKVVSKKDMSVKCNVTFQSNGVYEKTNTKST
jgi:hypothetical protein